MGPTRFVGTAELRRNPNALVAKVVDESATFYLTHHGKTRAVLMSIGQYNALLDLAEESEALYLPKTASHPESSVQAILQGRKAPRAASHSRKAT